MAHPKRKEAAEALALQLKAYPFMDVSITWDEKNEEWDTGYRAIMAGADRGDWHVVLQDDALLTPDFYQNLEGAINSVPERVLISLYTGTVKPMREEVKLAVEKAYYATWLKHYMLFWGVGFVLPTDHIKPLLEFVSEEQFAGTLYDIRVGMFYQRHQLPVFYTMPSLVNHDDDLGSLLEHDVDLEPRVAHRLAEGVVLWNQHVINI
jgi:hypothetical protein